MDQVGNQIDCGGFGTVGCLVAVSDKRKVHVFSPVFV
jgi:hypothetical protein